MQAKRPQSLGESHPNQNFSAFRGNEGPRCCVGLTAEAYPGLPDLAHTEVRYKIPLDIRPALG